MKSKTIEMAEAQKGIYFDCQIKNSLSYHVSVSLLLENTKEIYLENALRIIVAEQDALRSSFHLKDGKSVMCIQEEVDFKFNKTDLSGINEEDQIKEITEFVIGTPFDLSAAPLFRTMFINLSNNKHILIICCHHLISDGISMGIFKEKLLGYYDRLIRGKSITLKKDIGFTKFIEKENHKLENGNYKKQKEFWKKKMQGAEALALQNDYTLIENGLGKEWRVELPNDLVQKVETLSMDQEVTVFMFYLAAFNVLMNKYTRNEDIVVSSPFSYRPDFELEDTIGFFVQMLPIRCNIKNNEIFSNTLKVVSEQFIEVYKNIGYPNNMIMRDNALNSSIGTPSILDVSFVYDVYEPTKIGNIKAEVINQDVENFAGNMMVILNKTPDINYLKIQYMPNLYSDETINLLGNRFLKLLSVLIQNVHIKLNEIDLFLEKERTRILENFNQSSFFEYSPQTVVDIFQKKAKVYPLKTALISKEEMLTYGDVNLKANQLARKIIQYKKGDNDVVGLQLERSTNLIISVLAILKAGCAYVPIDPFYPASRKEFIFNDASISLLITSKNQPYDESWSVNLLFVDDADNFTGNESNLSNLPNPYGLAYIEYTSGSTGQPKGVMIEHHSLANTLLDLERRFPMGEKDVYMFKTAFTFDVSATEIYGWFMGAGSLLVLEAEGEKDPQLILETISNYKVTHINFVPSMFRLFLELFHKKINIQKLISLKWIFVGGEAVTSDIVRKFNALGTNISLENVYGPTECTIWASHYPLKNSEEKPNIPIGQPLNEIRWYVVGNENALQPVEIPGELCLSGVGLARGYLNREELTNEKFIENPYYQEGVDPEYFRRMYRTGDLVRWLPDGNIEFMGRIDFQVKIRGVRLELGEIENALSSYEGIIQAVVTTNEMANKSAVLCAYYMSKEEIQVVLLREFLTKQLPAYMIPSFFIHKTELPLNGSGKIDRKALIADIEHLRIKTTGHVAPQTVIQKKVAAIWEQVIQIRDIGVDDNFFEIGGHSVALMEVQSKLQNELDCNVSITGLFKLPTVRLQAEYISKNKMVDITVKEESKQVYKESYYKNKRIFNRDIAIIGMSINVPGADNLEKFWKQLKNGEESIHFYSDEELLGLGINESLIGMSNYVKAKGRVEGIEHFDPHFFGYAPGDMKMMPPQLRLLYKGIWEALEDAGYYPESNNRKIGVFLGGSDDFEWYRKALFEEKNYSDKYQAFTFSTNHFLASRLAYKLDIKGPVYTALTGCSTSLVTPHLSCQSLILGECDLAIAGGVTVELPNEGGYLYEDGMMFSPDGHCRPFDEMAKGTVFSNGMGLVVLKRLEEAVDSGDHIYAVIKGSAINNDGNQKVGFAAPSVEGQVEVIKEAYRIAGINPRTIGYLEAHGTGTSLGDPIEVESLTTAFETEDRQFCVLGSVKGNVGHTDTAAGVVGLEKVALSLYNKYIPGTVNYNTPNKKIEFQNTPFKVKNYGEDWIKNSSPRRAGINSFGIGGTNVHMVLEEAPKIRVSSIEDKTNLLVFSAKSKTALEHTSEKIICYLSENKKINLSDAAWTLQEGRKEFLYRKTIVVSEDIRGSKELYLNKLRSAKIFNVGDNEKDIYFMFSGQGSQYQGMGRNLYDSSENSSISKLYKYYIEKVFSALKVQKEEILEILYGSMNEELINQTKYSQISLFATEYAVAKTLMAIGIKPKGLIGHSIGEVVAAAVAGVWDLKDAVEIVMARGQVMQEQDSGIMLAVMADSTQIEKMSISGIWLALKNTTNKCVVGGKEDSITEFETMLKERGITYTRLKTSHAFHTPMMNKAAESFKKIVTKFTTHEPLIPIVSNISGTWVRKGEMSKEGYWADHIISPVNFNENLSEILKAENGVFIEVGAGRTLSTFAMQHVSMTENHYFVNMMRHPRENQNDVDYMYQKLGDLWSYGVKISWELLHEYEVRNRISLPTYQFDQHHYPIDLKSTEKLGSDFRNIEDNSFEKSVIISSLDDIEAGVINAYKAILGFDMIEAEEDFFYLGGDSLKGVSLAAILKNRFGINVEVTDIFNYTTPHSLAEYLSENFIATSDEDIIVPTVPSSYYPLSSAQNRMYTLYQLNPDNIAYNLPSATMIQGQLNKDRLEKALKKLINRHEAIRTTFEIREGQPVQMVHPSIELPIKYKKKAIGNKEEINYLIHDFVKPFCLEKAPLFRVELIEKAPDSYILLFDIHHIIADGTSVEIISRDFNQLYFNNLEDNVIHYKDYAVWQKKYLDSEKIKEQKKFWMNSLSGSIPVLELPTDFDRPKVKDFTGSRIYFKLDKEIGNRVSEIAQKAGATSYMTMLTAWFILLFRYSGQEDIIVGTPTAGRGQEEIKETVGMFVNMLAMRNFPIGTKKFIEFLNEVKENALNAFKNQDCQFEILTEQLNIKRETNRNALFDVCFDYQNMNLYDLEIEGIRFTPYKFDTNTASYDLVLTCQENKENEIECFIDYSTALFKEETIARLIKHFEKILYSVGRTQDIILNEIDMVTEYEKEFIQKNVNNTDLKIDEKVLIQEMFEKNVEKHPDKIALVVSSGREFTYSELNDKSNILAWELINRGIGRDSLVGILPERDEYLFVSILGILKAGAAYVPIDPEFPEDRVNYMIKKGEINTIICPKNFVGRFKFNGSFIDCSELEYDGNKLVDPVGRATRESLACVIFTSGSTGNPKGVMVNQESIINFVFDIINRKIFNSPEDRIICVTTISFDIFGFESITPLCTGNSIYLANRQEQLDPSLASNKIKDHDVTHILSTVSRIKAFIDNREFRESLNQFKCILSGGENYPLELLKDLQQNSSAKIFNMYGPTETTIWSTTKELTYADNINIGTPVANTQAYILNGAGNLQPIGIFGELCLGGRGLSRGYLKDIEETNNKFVNLKDNGVLVYRTGDRARVLSSGEIELMGRLDSQIKIRGYRIELNEIDKIAQQNINVSHVATIAYTDKNNNKQLAMFYCLKKEASSLKNSGTIWLKNWLAEKLPHYMIPSQLVEMDELPTLPNGKLNKNALILSRSIEVKADTIEKTQDNLSLNTIPMEIPKETELLKNAPLSTLSLEKSLQNIWRDILGIDKVSLNDNFFDLGGNSLGLILVNNKISKLLDYSIPLMQLFENPTINSLIDSLGIQRFNFAEDRINGERIAETVKTGESETVAAERKDTDIAVIGMDCKFPDADGIDEFWTNIVEGTESITTFSDDELINSGISQEIYSNPHYVKSKGYLKDVEYFDSDFFDYTQKESNLMDPQMRLLHQCCWKTLENGGYDSSNFEGKISLFAGSGSNVLWMAHSIGEKNNLVNAFETMTLNEKDFLTTKISYKLNLKGPSINVQTACSTSLVAVHQAAESLLNGEADMALAGGVSISFPRKEGYLWQEGMIFSKDGHCRPFSNDSSGTVSGNGCGMVLLKPLKKAMDDGDHIYAVIKGSAINNDGIEKIGYTAPSIAGQKNVIKEALKKAEVSAEDIAYVEAHGTGTKLGDPIEIEALKQAFGTDKKNYCAIGSVKANIGHLDTAAGIAGFIKAVLILYNRTLPPLINFNKPNEGLNLDNSPFYINTEKVDVKGSENKKLKVGVSSFGIGGTNVHLILEEAEVKMVDKETELVNTLIFSARSKEALYNTCSQIMKYLENNRENLTDAALTLQCGRRAFEYRKTLNVKGNQIDFNNESVKKFLLNTGKRIPDSKQHLIFFLAGSEYLDKKFTLWDRISCHDEFGVFYYEYREKVWLLLTAEEQKSIDLILKGYYNVEKQERMIAVFTLDYAVSKALIKIGVKPELFIGYGVGEIVSMAVSGMISVEEALAFLRDYRNVDEQDLCRDVNQTCQLQKPDIPVITINDSNLKNISGDETILLHIGFKESINVINSNWISRLQDEKIINMFSNLSESTDNSVNEVIAELWTLGWHINWKMLRRNAITTKKIPLPGYVFDKKMYKSDVSLNSFHVHYRENKETELSAASAVSYTKEEVRQELSCIWVESLGCNPPRETENFFELGGHSLGAISMASRVKEVLGVDLPLSEIFENPSFEKMVEWVFAHSDKRSSLTILPVETKSRYEVSSAQKRMYTVNEMLEDCIPYNLASVYTIHGLLEKQKWMDTFRKLVDRHESFRTRFLMEGNEIFQIIEKEGKVVLEFAKIEEWEVEKEVKKFIRPFDLRKSPLMRAKIFSTSNTKHVLIIDMHHIISDQSSVAILLKEFQQIYSGVSLEPLSIQYKDFAEWQNQLMEQDEVKKQIDYWMNEFRGEIPSLDLHTDFERYQTISYKGSSIHYDFGERLSEKIMEVSKECSVTPYMLLLSALKLLLWKYTGQKDIIIGTGVAGRRHTSLESIVGMFVNTLAIRSQIDSSMTIKEYLYYIKEKMIGSYENQECQFEMLLEKLNIKTNLSRNPLFDIMFNYINMGTEELEVNGLKLEPWKSDEIDTKFDLTCTVQENNGRFYAELEYAKDLFKNSTINELGNRLVNLIEFIADNLDGSLTDISIINGKEKKWLIHELNCTQSAAPLHKSVIQIFEEQVSIFGKREAVIWGKNKISYEELNSMANQMAVNLSKAKVQVKDKVAILLERGPLQIVSILSILKCGGVYVPIDTDYPIDRINYMMEDSGVSLLITTGQNARKNTTKVQNLILEELLLNKSEPKDFISRPLNGEDNIYIIYTSGSTGTPKGTLITHGNVIRVVKDTNYIKILPEDRLLNLSNYAFDGSVFDLFGALLNGACVVMVEKEVAIDMVRLAEIYKQNEITVSFITSALFNMMVEWDITAFQTVRKLLVGGEVLSMRHARTAFEYLGSERFINMYGPTETTVYACYYPINSIEEDLQDMPIGYPVSNTTLYVLDEDGQLVPPNVPGELYIGGAGVAIGYLNRPELTEEKFRYPSFLNKEKVYRTGDRVKRLATGEIMFLGRTDYQIKIRGFRVELGEIEKLIQTIKSVKEVIVTVQKDKAGSLYIAAYYTADADESGEVLSPIQVRKILTEKLPEYMVPSRLKRMDKFPLNVNGKVDRKALPLIENDERVLELVDKPRNEIEAVILCKMQLILDNYSIGIKDDFFQSGGQSLKAIAFVQALSKEGIKVKVNEVFQHTTVEELAQLPEVKKLWNSGDIIKEDELLRIKDSANTMGEYIVENEFINKMKCSMEMMEERIFSSGEANRFPLSAVQKLHISKGSNLSGFTYYVDGNLSEMAMRRLLAEIIQSNQLLHSKIMEEYKECWVEYDIVTLKEAVSEIIPYCDISDYDNTAKTKYLELAYSQILRSPYGVNRLPWRLCCIKLERYRYLIIWGFDHSAFDGMSADIIRAQIESQVEYYSRGEPDFNSRKKINKSIQPYEEYTVLLAEGPSDIVEKEIIHKFSLMNWKKQNNLVMEKISCMSGDSNNIKIKIPLPDWDDLNPCLFAFEIIYDTLVEYMGMDEIPIAIVDYGRKYKGKGFYNCIGEFLDIIPLLFSNKPNETMVSELLEICSEKNINYLSILTDDKLKKMYPTIFELLNTSYITNEDCLNLLLFNFQGFVPASESQAFASTEISEQKLAKLLITANYDEENMNIEMDCVTKLDCRFINNILSKKADFYPIVDIVY